MSVLCTTRISRTVSRDLFSSCHNCVATTQSFFSSPFSCWSLRSSTRWWEMRGFAEDKQWQWKNHPCRAMKSPILLVVWILVVLLPSSLSYQTPKPIARWTKGIQSGYEQRIAADPSFPVKSITEVFLAAGTQLTAEWSRRGADRLLPEIDFVFPAILAAVFGKYYRYVQEVVTYCIHNNIISQESRSNFLSYVKADFSGKGTWGLSIGSMWTDLSAPFTEIQSMNPTPLVCWTLAPSFLGPEMMQTFDTTTLITIALLFHV